PPLWPRDAVRQSPIQAVVLSDAEIDHTLGLLSLREARHLCLHATAWVYQALREANPLLRTLQSFCAVEWRPGPLWGGFPLRGAGIGGSFVGPPPPRARRWRPSARPADTPRPGSVTASAMRAVAGPSSICRGCRPGTRGFSAGWRVVLASSWMAPAGKTRSCP